MLISCVSAFATQWKKGRNLKSAEYINLCNIQVHIFVFSLTLNISWPQVLQRKTEAAELPDVPSCAHTNPFQHTCAENSQQNLPSTTRATYPPCLASTTYSLTLQSDFGTSYKSQVVRAWGHPGADIWCTPCLPVASDSPRKDYAVPVHLLCISSSIW